MLKKNFSTFIIFILLPIAVGLVSSLLSGDIPGDYIGLNQPEISPPGNVFPVVWTILYVLMGVSSYLVFISQSPLRNSALKIYFIQLALNFLWSPIFFGLNLYFLGFVWILLLIIFILIMIVYFYRINPLAGILQVPYLLWCIFAAYLSYMINTLNSSNYN